MAEDMDSMPTRRLVLRGHALIACPKELGQKIVHPLEAQPIERESKSPRKHENIRL